MQKYANLVELEKCCQTHIHLQNFVSIQPRTSPVTMNTAQHVPCTDPRPAPHHPLGSNNMYGDDAPRRRRGREAEVLPLASPAAPKLKGSIVEGPNHSNYSDQSSVRILGIQRKPRKAPSRKKPLQRSGSRPKIQEGAARKERKGKQTALRERGVRRSRIGAKDAIHAVKRCYA